MGISRVIVQDLANAAFDRCERQYAGRLDKPLFGGSTPRDTLRQLAAKGPTPRPADVDHIMGNTSWTRLTCYLCAKDVEQAALLETDHDSRIMCKPCLTAALAVFPLETLCARSV